MLSVLLTAPAYAAPRDPAADIKAAIDPAADIKAAIDPIVAQLSKKYDCAISVALRGSGTAPRVESHVWSRRRVTWCRCSQLCCGCTTTDTDGECVCAHRLVGG